MTEERAAVLRKVAARVQALPRPALVAVDGVTAAGKTTFADALAALMAPPVVRVSVDDFHRPEAERHARGKGPESYYYDTFDLPQVRAALEAVDAVAIAIVDGVFLLRPELADLWSLTIFLAADRQVALERAIERDAALMDGVDAARLRYASRYFPGETLYLEAVDPQIHADVVIENTDPQRPVKRVSGPGLDARARAREDRAAERHVGGVDVGDPAGEIAQAAGRTGHLAAIVD